MAREMQDEVDLQEAAILGLHDSSNGLDGTDSHEPLASYE